jgi:hypothetical protein
LGKKNSIKDDTRFLTNTWDFANFWVNPLV